MAAQPVKGLPEGKEWLYELKLDGYRALLIKAGTDIRLMSRNHKDLTRMYPTVAGAGLRLKADQAIVDGEIVALDDAGMPSFQALQHRALHPRHQIVFYAFDLLQLNRRDLTSTPLTKRRSQLAKIVDPDAYLRLLPELPGSAEDVVQAVLEIGLEGVVAKRRDSLYQPGERSADWLKLVLERKQEFVIGGYRLDAPRSIGSLLVGYYEGKQFRFASKVHGGLTPHLRRELLDTLSCRWKPPAVRSPNALDSAQSDRADPIRRLDGGKPAPSCEVHRLAHG
jgi:bifunctional non-homologous end joining protein LigD